MPKIGPRGPKTETGLPLPVLERWGQVLVVRDDLIPGGTKARVVPRLFDARQEYVYASPCQGYAQVALAICGRAHDRKITIFCAARRQRHPRSLEALAAGARLEEVGPAGYMSVVRARANDYCRQTGACLLPFGLHCPSILDGLAEVARGIPEPSEVWTVAGSGTLSLALQEAWPGAAFNAVVIGARLENLGRAKLWHAPERFEQDAKAPPPFPSCGNYDAKAWRFILAHAGPGALFWNVAG